MKTITKATKFQLQDGYIIYSNTTEQDIGNGNIYLPLGGTIYKRDTVNGLERIETTSDQIIITEQNILFSY